MERSASGPAAANGGGAHNTRERARQIAMIALALLAAAFALLNLREVKVNFIVMTTRAPLIIVVVACLAVGLALGLAAGRKRG